MHKWGDGRVKYVMCCSQSAAQQHGATRTTKTLHETRYSKNNVGRRTGITEYPAIFLYGKLK